MSGRRGGPLGSVLGRPGNRASTGALLYLAPWFTGLLMIPLALVFWGLAASGQAGAVAIGVALAAGGTALTVHTWNAFAPRKDTYVQGMAAGSIGTAVLWVIAAAMFGLFHRPDVDIWPEIWRIPEYALKSFTLPIWGTWIVWLIFGSIAWNITRAGKPEKVDGGQGKDELSPLQRVIDGATIHVESEVGPNGVIKGSLTGDPGRHTQKDLLGMAPGLEPVHGLRPGAINMTPDYSDSRKVNFTVTVKDPHLAATPWPGPSHPGASIAEFPIPLGPYTDGEIAAEWLCGDEETGRPSMHKKISGVNGSGKTQGWRMAIADALTRKDFELFAADISGKVWQTFGDLLPYARKIAGTNGTTEAARRQNLKDTLELIKWVANDAAERQEKWGKAGFNQWSPECFTRWGDKQRCLVIEEGSEILERYGQEVKLLAERCRSGGWILFVVVQQMHHTNIPTQIRSQLPGAYCFGQDNSRDAGMVLPEDVMELLSRDGADGPGNWQNQTPGKAIVIYAGQDKARRTDPIRFYWAKNEAVRAALEMYAERVHSEAYIEQLREGENVQTPADVQTPGHTNDPDVQTDSEEDEYKVPDEPEELADIQADPTEKVQLDDPADNVSFGPPEVPDPPAPLPTKEFRALIQRHLMTILARGEDVARPVDISAMRPGTGHSQANIRNELKRLATAAEPWEIGTIEPMTPGGEQRAGHFKLVTPTETRPKFDGA